MKLYNNILCKIVFILMVIILGKGQLVWADSNKNKPYAIGTKEELSSINRSRLKKAEKYYKKESFRSAIKQYEKIISKGDSLPFITKRLAESYMKINKYERSQFWYQKLYKTNKMSDTDLYHYIEVLKVTEDYQKAFEISRSKPGLTKMYPQLSEFTMETIQKLKSDSSRYNFRLSPISSEASDICPAYVEGKIVFASNRGKRGLKDKRTNASFLGLYSADVNADGSPGNITPIKGKINTVLNEGNVSYSKSENAIYYTINDPSLKKIGDTKVSNLMVVRSQRKGRNWGKAEILNFNDTIYSCSQPSISDDGMKLFFSSDKPGGYGGTDIYVSKRINGKWSEPVNLGEKINTIGDEMFPYIFKNSTLYFSSDKISGLGGLDIYVSKIKNGKYTKAENMGYPINSSHDDFGLLLLNDKYEGYLTSNRSEKDDIYHFTREFKDYFTPVDDYYVMDAKKGSLIIDPLRNDLKGDIDKFTLSGFTSSAGGSIRKDPETGLFKYISPTNFTGFDTISYIVTYKLIDHSDEAEGFIIVDVKSNEIEIDTERLNFKMTLYFDFDKADIREDAAFIINSKIIPFLSKYPELQYELSAYTDALGTDTYNMKLSEKRANTILTYLKEKLKNVDNISVHSYGEKLSRQNIEGLSVSDLQSDRKVEIIVLQK